MKSNTKKGDKVVNKIKVYLAIPFKLLSILLGDLADFIAK